MNAYPNEACGSPRHAPWAIGFLVVTPLLGLAGLAWQLATVGIHASDVGIFVAYYAFNVMGITAGYHRYYSHKTFECARPIQALFLISCATALQNSVLHWVSNHRYHHQHADTDADPYNIKRGFFWAHMGWIFYKDPDNRPFANVPDLKKDALVMWQYKHYWTIAFGIGMALPLAAGALFGHPWTGLLWGGLLRMVAVHHVTFFINSAAHVFGKPTHDPEATARDNGWLAVITFGEGYHSFHHAYPADYRNGHRWYHVDAGKWFIAGLEKLGLAWKLRRVPDERIRATIEACSLSSSWPSTGVSTTSL